MVRRIEIAVLVDNYIDIFIPSTGVATYPGPGKHSRLWGEPGLSLGIDVWRDEERVRILYDFGRSDRVLLHNAHLLGFGFGALDWLVLSHGHGDHHGGLRAVLRQTGQACKLVLHPGAVGARRYVRLQNGTYEGVAEVKSRLMREFGPRIEARREPLELAPGVWVSGEIEKKTDFEKGMSNAFVKRDGGLVHDEIEDDQALFIELEKQGLLVLTGCCHAGLVNTLMYAQKLFPGRKIHALVGGLHLNAADEKQMKETMDYVAGLDVGYIAPLHCTGYYAQRRLMERFRDRWIPGTVGARMTFTSGR